MRSYSGTTRYIDAEHNLAKLRRRRDPVELASKGEVERRAAGLKREPRIGRCPFRRARIGTRGNEGTNSSEREPDALVHAGAARQALAAAAVRGDRDDQPGGRLPPPRPLQRRTSSSPPSSATLTLQFLPRLVRALLFALVGRRAHRAELLQARPVDPRAVPPGRGSTERGLAEQLYTFRLPGQGAAGGRDRRRHRALGAAPRHQEVHRQHRRDRHGRGRRRLERPAPRGVPGPATGRHPPVPHRAGRDRAADDRALPAPLRR